MKRALCAAALGTTVALVALAAAGDPHAAGLVAIALDGIGYGDPAPIDYSVTAGVDARLAFGPEDTPITYATGIEYRLGATSPGGFAYALTLLPAGVGVLIDEVLFFAVSGGAGVSGVTTRVGGVDYFGKGLLLGVRSARGIRHSRLRRHGRVPARRHVRTATQATARI